MLRNSMLKRPLRKVNYFNNKIFKYNNNLYIRILNITINIYINGNMIE